MDPQRSETGATMLEFSLGFIIILICLYGIIEVGRYTLVQSMVSKSAEEGLNYAQKIAGIDLDTRACADDTCSEYLRYKSARQLVINRTLYFVSTYLQPSTDTASPNRLTSYRIEDELNDFTYTAPAIEADVMLLRPGEFATDIHTGSIISHPTLCSQNDSNCVPGKPRLFGATSWADTMRNHPLVVVTGGLYRPIVNFWLFDFPPVYVRGVAVGYREPPTNTRVPPDMRFPIPPVIPPTPPPTPVPTPPCSGDYCGGACLPYCTTGFRDWSTCACDSGGCSTGQVECPAGSKSCISDCGSGQTMNMASCSCGCSAGPCPFGTRDPVTCACPSCSLSCSGGGAPNSTCTGCSCTGVTCPVGQMPDSNCVCTGSCPTGTSPCGGVCAPDPVSCETRDGSCNIVPSCSACGKITCSGSCVDGAAIASSCSSQPGMTVVNGGCDCVCGGGACGACGTLSGGAGGCTCGCSIGCGAMGSATSNVDPGSPACHCSCGGSCGLGSMDGDGGCGPCSCNCGGADCGLGSVTGGGDSACTCDCGGVGCGIGSVAGGGTAACSCDCSTGSCGMGNMTGGGSSSCSCDCSGVACGGGSVTGGGSSACACDCSAVPCAGTLGSDCTCDCGPFFGCGPGTDNGDCTCDCGSVSCGAGTVGSDCYCDCSSVTCADDQMIGAACACVDRCPPGFTWCSDGTYCISPGPCPSSGGP